MIFRFLICSFIAIFSVAGAQAQQQKKRSWNDQFILDKSGKPFPVQDSFTTLNDKVYDFRMAKHPAFVYISSESCIPCKFELPLYIEACKQYPSFDFIYFTTDQDTDAVEKKFGNDFKLANLYII